MIRPRSHRFVDSKTGSGRRTREGAPVIAPPDGGEAVARSPAAYLHHAIAGQSAQFGRRGRHTRWPTSMRACVHAAAWPGGTAASASDCIEAAVKASGPPATIRPSTRLTLTSTAPAGTPNAIAATARAV